MVTNKIPGFAFDAHFLSINPAMVYFCDKVGLVADTHIEKSRMENKSVFLAIETLELGLLQLVVLAELFLILE